MLFINQYCHPLNKTVRTVFVKTQHGLQPMCFLMEHVIIDSIQNILYWNLHQ